MLSLMPHDVRCYGSLLRENMQRPPGLSSCRLLLVGPQDHNSALGDHPSGLPIFRKQQTVAPPVLHHVSRVDMTSYDAKVETQIRHSGLGHRSAATQSGMSISSLPGKHTSQLIKRQTLRSTVKQPVSQSPRARQRHEMEYVVRVD